MSQDQPIQPQPVDRSTLNCSSLRDGAGPAGLCLFPYCYCFSDSDD